MPLGHVLSVLSLSLLGVNGTETMTKAGLGMRCSVNNLKKSVRVCSVRVHKY